MAKKYIDIDNSNEIQNDISILEDAMNCAYKGEVVGFFDKIIRFLSFEHFCDDTYSFLEENINKIEDEVNEKKVDDRVYIYIMSVMIQQKKKKEDLLKLSRWLYDSDLAVEYKYWVFKQLSVLVFNHPLCFKGLDEFVVNSRLLSGIVDDVAKLIPNELLWYIPESERDDSLVIVITIQMLSFNHGPTKTALDRCATIINKLHKKVLLINTAENGSDMVKCPFYRYTNFYYAKEYNEMEYIEWKGVRIPFFQCEDNQLNISVIQLLVKTIRDLKPGMIIEVGAGSIVASLADRMIPVLSDGLAPSSLQYSITSCQTLFREVTDEEVQALNKIGQNEKNVIYTVFTSSLKERTMKISRKEIGIPESSFAIALVGGRLDVDINEEIVEIMMEVADDNTVIVLIGNVSDKSIIYKYSELSENIICCGMVNDTRAYLECCDIYLNPRRMGGGTSAVEAMDVGLPVVSFDFGDVSVNVGSDFVCDSVDEMISLINRYKTDIEFYGIQSFKAKERANYLQDSELHFCKTLEGFRSRFV